MEWDAYLRTLLVLVFVLGLITGLAWLLRRFGSGRFAMRPAHKRRLDIVEILALDSRRKLVLVRRDRAEHLLLIGGATDLVIEQNAVPTPKVEIEIEDPRS
ncbi:MAG: flagellar biosynthetic protein FliO [Rhodospirillaceae bacterium]|nr:flagellar biosynthetic protein FliO [Rhodospirillaceae bacterium]